MSKKIYVGNLNYSTIEDTLGGQFAQYGDVLSVTIIKDRDTHQSKGFGFVEMDDENAAERAIAELNGREIDGRRIRVNVAEEKPRRDRAPRSFGRGPRGGYRDGGFRDNDGGFDGDRY
ncbi:MAG TPA: RNA-binding protein [Treponema sp.]|nr:RNA-binding protein [Treponema sp.]